MPFVRANGKKFLPSKSGQPLREYNPASLPPPAPVSSGSSSSSSSTSSSPARRISTRTRSRTTAPSSLVPHILDDLLSPGPTAKDTAEAAHRLGVKPRAKQETLLDQISKVIADAGDAASQTVQEVSKGAHEAQKQIQKATALPDKRVSHVLGTKTLGTPTVKQLVRSAVKDQVQTNSAGKLTIPATRHAARQLAGLRVKKAKLTGPLPGLDAEAQKNARTYLRTGKKAGASQKELLAALETGLVESHFHNLQYGDADSKGVRQERVSQYGEGPTGATNVGAGAKRFFEESVSDTGGARGAGQTAGQLAQTIQGSAYPERYDEVKPQAAAILRAFQEGGKAPPKLAAQLGQAEQVAQRLGIDTDVAAAGARHFGSPTKQVVNRYKAGLLAAEDLDKAQLPYVWGGGHVTGQVTPTGGGLDCSGAVSYVLQHMGVKLPGGVTSGEMGNYLQAGPGAITVFYNGEHTFMKIGKRYFGTSHANPAGGAGFIPTSYEQGEAESGKYNVAHVPGLGGKVALQLGIPLTGGAAGTAASFPGMAISADGTTAQITGGQKKETAGFSSSPIIFSSAQGAHATLPTTPAVGAVQPGAEGEEAVPGQLSIINEILQRRRS